MLKTTPRSKRSALERVYRVRLENIRKIVTSLNDPSTGRGGQAKLARALGVNASFITHLAGESPLRTCGEALARNIEQKLGLLPGYMDQIHN